MIKVVAKISIFILLLICVSLDLLHANKGQDTIDFYGGGLKFLSQQAYVKDRTSLSLFPKPKNLKGDISLSFDCDIYDANRFGYIFRFITVENGKEKVLLQLLQNPEILKPETFKLELYSPLTKSQVDFTLPAKKLNKLKLSIQYSKDDGAVTINCNGVEKSIAGINLNKSKTNVVFGLWGLDEDVAAMILKNIRINENRTTSYFWPLNEFEGNQANEIISGIASNVSNPVWLRKEHYYWKKISSFKADDMAGIIFKEKSQEINIINNERMIVYSPYTDKQIDIRYSSEGPFETGKHFSTYNEAKNQIISYDFRFLKSPPGKKLYSILDENNLKWSSIDETELHWPNHHHRSFWNSTDETFTTFAGYSNFTYHNDFNTFDFSTNTWTKIELEGDFISPREYTVIGQQNETGLIYVYGGYGNESGRQALGGQVYKDLFSVDLSHKSIKKIMDFEEFTPEFVPHGSLIFGNKEGTIFYTLMSSKGYELDLRLFEINTLKKTITPVSDTLKVNMGSHKTHTKSNIYLFKDSVAQKLYCVCREVNDLDNSEITIYSLNFPPSNLPEIIPNVKLGKNTYLLSGFGAILALLLVLYFVRKRKVSLVKQSVLEYSRQAKNAIWFLGGFQVFDSNGKDITYRFSKKLKELFVLIITETVQNKGISSKELSDKLWPGMNNLHQKNNRGVTINAVRKVLEDMQGISLEIVNNNWKIECADDCFFDFARINKLLGEENATHQNEIISLLSYGNLLPFLQFDWLDKIKAAYENEMISILLSICNDYYSKKNYLACFETAGIIHAKYDEINELALKYKIIALNKMRGYSKSKNEFSLFKKRYFATYQEEFKLTIDEINNIR